MIEHPWSLLALLGAVAAAATLALARPSRRETPVSSLRLWRSAAAAAQSFAATHRRKLTLPWLLLLLGALCAALGSAGPVWTRERPARHISIAIYNAAELAAPEGRQRLRDAAERLLNRLYEADRVELLLPAPHGRREWLSPAQAKERLAEALAHGAAVKAKRLAMGEADSRSQHEYRLAPACLNVPDGPGLTNVPISTACPPVTLDAFAAADLSDGRGQAFWAVRNQTAKEQRAALTVEVDGKEQETRAITLAGGQRATGTFALASSATQATVSLGPAVGQQATLRRGGERKLRIAALAPPGHPLRRFMEVCPQAEPVTDLAQADVVFSDGAELPPGKSGIVFDPPAPPEGWRRDEDPAGPIVLAEAVAVSESAILEGVDLAGVAVRRPRFLIAHSHAGGARLLSMPAGVLALATERPRRVYLAFGLSQAETNWAAQESLVVFLLNALHWLTADSPPRSWELTSESAGTIALASADAPPVNIEQVPLPQPILRGDTLDLWPFCSVGAGMFWVAGWYLQVAKRTRGRREPAGEVEASPANHI